MGELTDHMCWDLYWKDARLPITVDRKSDPYYRTLDELFRIHLGRSHKRFLEVGCGSSKWLIYFFENFRYDVYGVDSSEKACNLSKMNMRLMGVPGEVLCSDIFDPPFHGPCFDVILSGGLIEHFTNPQAVLKRMVALLRPGGHLITSVPNIESIYWVIQKLIDKKVYEQHFKITIKALGSLYERLGLRIDVIRYVGSFDLFSIDWSRIRSRSKTWRTIGMPLVGKINGAINLGLKKSKIDFRSRVFSPFIIVIGYIPF